MRETLFEYNENRPETYSRLIPTAGRRGFVSYLDGILCLFAHDGEQPILNEPTDVMICALLPLNKSPKGTLIVQPITNDHILVAHQGFSCEGTMCRTTANVTKEADVYIEHRYGKPISWITPGRTPINEVSNVNVRVDQSDRRPAIPGYAYVSIKDLNAGHQRICGVPTLDQLLPGLLSKLKSRSR